MTGTEPPDKIYGVQFKSNVNARAWITLPGTGGNAMFSHSGAATWPTRFYRIFGGREAKTRTS